MPRVLPAASSRPSRRTTTLWTPNSRKSTTRSNRDTRAAVQALAGAAPAPTPGDGHQTRGKPPSDAALGFFAIRRLVPLAPAGQ
ncbi:hypothetical protein CBM2589_B220218 [Cupriavidus taiwanensis]|uniref:Uncharacterized protein n=1 Tax=Cupriavidus taiwanensis TaxID=164546 RepID=A0A375BP89_9BURK|nr:hypothetical protein CBM2589_B220218 [Cupriavidus taiwanensis]